MPTVQQLLDDINARYRSTFTTDQKVKWMDMVQKRIYQVVRHEAPPYTFTTVKDQAFYALPSDCDIKGIEQITLDINGKGTYEKLNYKTKDAQASEGERFYSIVERNLFLYPVPTATTEKRKVYLYYRKRPAALSSTTDGLAKEPNLPEDFHELLVLGTLERVCGARKDVVMKNNYAMDFAQLLEDYEWQLKMTDPQFIQPIDTLPRRGSYGAVASTTSGT